jgi:hypothetical protein
MYYTLYDSFMLHHLQVEYVLLHTVRTRTRW